MNLEDSVKDVIQQKLSDGTIEKIIEEKMEKGISEAMGDLFRSYGDVGEVIKKKVKEVMVPAIEKHDFSDHIVKLDTVLTEIVNSTALVENKKLLENFKELMIEDETKKVIKVSELFGEWCNYVAKEVDTDGLAVEFDDGPSYEGVDVTMVVEHGEGREWSRFENANIVFECEHDDKMNILIPISKWTGDKKWNIGYKQEATLDNLKYLNKFEVFVLKLKRMFCELELDEEEIEESVSPESEPEASFS